MCTVQKILSLFTLYEISSENEPGHENSNDAVYATTKGSEQPAHMRSLIRSFANSLNIL